MRRTLTIAAAAAILSLTASLAAVGGATAADGGPSANPAPASTPLERVHAYVQPSVVIEEIVWSGRVFDTFNNEFLNDGRFFHVTFQCTGFVVNPDGYVGTAGHCVRPAAGATSELALAGARWGLSTNYYDTTLRPAQIVKGNDYVVVGRRATTRPFPNVTVHWRSTVSGLDVAESKPARIIDSQRPSAGDVALLKVDATGLNAIKLASDASITVGQSVVSVGYPVSVGEVTDVDLEPSFKPGSVSSEKTISNGLVTVYEISAAVSGGMSGGPTVNMDGAVVGVNSFGIVGEPQAFNFFRPASSMDELLSGAGVPNELSADSRAYRKGLDAYFAGDRATAISALTTVTQNQPANGLAADYLKQARALPKPPPPESAFPWTTVLIVGGAVLLLLIAAGITLLVMSRRRRPAAPVGAAAAAAVGTPPAATVPGQAAPPTAETVPPPSPAPVGFSGPPEGTAGPPQQDRGGTAGQAGQQASPGPPASPAPSPPAPSGSGLTAGPATCSACGATLAAGQRFCGNCGTPR